ncbi:MAG: VCBS repeat-containing protein [Acidobacteria bacterium]|nr:VCBS repeat-containing protein [Acidobacteriota bacterium]
MTVMLFGLLFQQSTEKGLASGAAVDSPALITIPVAEKPNAIVSGDFNHDNRPDLAIICVGLNVNSIGVLLNTGGGSFSAPVYYAAGVEGYFASTIKTADFNGDGHLDLATAISASSSFGTSYVQLRFGNGAGGFSAPATTNASNYPNGLTVADFTGDGKPDLATVNTGPGLSCHGGYEQSFINNGSGGLTAGPLEYTRPISYSITSGDFNSDGKIDLAVRGSGDGGCGQPVGAVTILIGAGTGTFTVTNNLAPETSPAYLATADLNHDGKLDLVGPNGGDMKALLGTGAGDFVIGTPISVGGNTSAAVVADFNLDGNQDVASVNSAANTSVVAYGNGVGGFVSTNSFGTGIKPTSLIPADFNGDGRPDLAVTNYDSSTLTINLDVNTPTTPIRTQFDFDGDLRADIAVYRDGNTPGAPSFWHILRSSDNTYLGYQLGANGDKPVPADYNGDGKTEVAVWRPSNGTWYTSTNAAINYGAFGWGQNGDVPLPEDFDGDGKTDYVVYRPANGTWYLYRSVAGFQMQQFGTVSDKPVMGDYDGDGKADFAFYRPGATALAASFWNVILSSNGQFLSAQFGRGEDKPVPADYDANRITNFAVYRPSNLTWYTSLDPAINYGAFVWGAEGDVPAPADYDRDGRADLTVFRPGSSIWYIRRSSDGVIVGQRWGVPSDRPVPSSFVP